MALDKRNLYRMPWSLNDNAIAWLEVSDICNIHCEGCYRQTITGHKTLDQVKEEVLMFKRWRNPDNISIAGGEPLIYPHIVDLVAFIKEQKIKPVILTNAYALKPEILRELKQAGLSGFTIHIDSHQNRPGWTGKTEKELNVLRQQYADMIYEARNLYVIFNSTVYPSTYAEIPDIVEWGRTNFDRVHGLVFITYRTATTKGTTATDLIDHEVELGKLSYATESFDEKFVTSPEVAEIINNTFPMYQPASYLGGTIKHDSYKWLIGALIGTKNKHYGSVGKQTMELAQVGHHIFTGTYLAYLSQAHIGFIMSVFDKTVRQAFKNWFGTVVRKPWYLFKGIHVQSIGIIQAPDILPDGRADMCDSCPDITIYDGKFINSCRMDEYRLFGGFVTVKKQEEVE
jgi:MoaA/NifB/PqqE/SkfB family radical SAM enzyme